MGTKIEFR